MLLLLPQVAGGLGAALGQVGDSVSSASGLLQGRGAIELPAGGAASTVGGAPIVEGLPQFTRDPQLQFSGRVPGFAIQSGRRVQIVLNGNVVSTDQLTQTGTFSAGLTLREGANTISVSLLAERDVVATSSYNVTLDRTPPALTITRPQSGSVVDARSIVVEGKTEPGASVSVNGRTVATSPEGIYSDSFTATAGPLTITVVSRDRAGNETTAKVSIVASESVQTATTSVAVALDRTSARPAQFVLATVTVRDASGPRSGVQVTLSVGVVLVGSATTDKTGTALLPFAAPTTEGEIGVVALAAGTSGRATLTVSTR